MQKGEFGTMTAANGFEDSYRSGSQLAGPTITLTLLLALGLAMRVIHWSPSADGDEARYINHAYALAQRTLPEYFDGAVAVRLPYLAYLAGWGKLFGMTTPSLQSAGLATFVIVGLLLWTMARRLYDIPSAHVALAIFAFLPIHIRLATHCLTDDLGLAFALGSMLLWIKAFDVVQGKVGRFYLWVALSGLAAGIATGVRQPFFLLALILPASSLLQGHKAKICALAAAVFGFSALIYFGLEAFGFWWWLGNPGFRFFQDVLQNAGHAIDAPRNRPLSLSAKLFYFRGYLGHLLPSGSFSFLPLLAGIAIVDRWSRARYNSIHIIIALCVLTAYHFWGTTSIHSWNLPAINARYLIPAAAFGCILTGGMLAAVHRHYRFSQATILVAAGAMIVISTWTVAYVGRPNCVTEFARYLATLREEQRQRIIIPESVKRCFLPTDYWQSLEGMRVVPDEMIAKIEDMPLHDVDAIAVPNETFYTYSHIGVVDALERTANWWERRDIVGQKWPRYLTVTGKPSNRVIGYLYYRTARHDRDSGNRSHPGDQ
ncbi:MAG: hypothetical protein GYA33_10195 [Thermogutta sp.]|nr:hypothetical protein [Thermogutta sp.]